MSTEDLWGETYINIERRCEDCNRPMQTQAVYRRRRRPGHVCALTARLCKTCYSRRRRAGQPTR